jgi:hypothetical protein
MASRLQLLDLADPVELVGHGEGQIVKSCKQILAGAGSTSRFALQRLFPSNSTHGPSFLFSYHALNIHLHKAVLIHLRPPPSYEQPLLSMSNITINWSQSGTPHPLHELGQHLSPSLSSFLEGKEAMCLECGLSTTEDYKLLLYYVERPATRQGAPIGPSFSSWK